MSLFLDDPPGLDPSRPDEYLVPRSGDSLNVGSSPDPARAETTEPKSPGGFGFQGTFLSEEVVLPGSLEVRGTTVTLWANGMQLASWSHPACTVQRMGASQFSIEAEGEMITFTADDPEGLNTAVKVFLASSSQGPKAALMAIQPGSMPPELSERETSQPRPTLPGDATVEQVLLEQALLEQAGLEPGVLEPGEIEDLEDTPTPRRRRRPRVKAAKAATKQAGLDQGKDQPVVSEDSDLGAAAVGLDGDPVVTDPAIASTGATIADRITENAKRRYRSAKAHRWLKSDIEQVAIKTGVIASAIGILTLFAVTVFVIAGGFGGEPEVVTVARTTVPPPSTTFTTVVATTVPPSDPSRLFQTDSGELTARWNALAEQSRPELALFNELSSPFLVTLSPFITLEGLLDPAAGSVVLRATPTGTPEGDGLILTSLGLLIGTADPTLDGPDRRSLLETLGLSIQDPQLGGLNGTATHNGLTYHLAFIAEAGVLEFRISPEGAVTTTTTTTTVAP